MERDQQRPGLRPIDMDSSEPVARRVFRELRRAIVRMAFLPGQALSEQDIADQLGVSRQPVREAFIKLSEAGLLLIRPQRGSFIVKISVRQVFDARFVREAVEVAVVARAAAEAAARHIDEFRDNLKQQADAVADRDHGRFMELDEAFHRAIALSVGCDYAWRVVEETKAQMDRARYLSIADTTPLPRLIAQHTAVVDAIAAHDGEAAQAAMRTHLREILTSLPELEKRFPALFNHDVPETP
ncbi:GntR family transcriptional regulator [Niveispirillum fermenti]|uniref:GntR family transcriptional regulator n=1 Tax=Niveispirillum fermenti TaxID=1233113 RepID=UPI003A866995